MVEIVKKSLWYLLYDKVINKFFIKAKADTPIYVHTTIELETFPTEEECDTFIATNNITQSEVTDYEI